MIDYLTVDELRTYLRINDTADDVYLGFAVSAASRSIDIACNRSFDPQLITAEKRIFEADGYRVQIDDLFTVDGLIVDGTYRLSPREAPWTSLVFDAPVRGLIEVTARFGWPEIPAAIKQATLIQASRFFVRRDSPYGIAGSPDAGSELRLQARLDPDVAVSIRPYYRWWATAAKGIEGSGYSSVNSEVSTWS